MIVLSPERMAKYDAYAIETWGIPSAVLMENAGRGTYRIMKDRYLDEGSKVAVFCGRGNNGGDGFVIARYGLRDGFRTRVFLLGRKGDLKGDAALNMGLYESLGGEIIEVETVTESIGKAIAHSTYIVDAIFGTGLSKAVAGLEHDVIEAINRSGKPVIAVDIPSGIDGKTGSILGCAVHALHTCTFGYPKIGHVLYPGAFYAGEVTVIDISLPDAAKDKLGIDGEIVEGPMLRSFLKGRRPWAHKGSFGHVAVIAGSTGKTGAASMASTAALKIGAGLVTLVVPESLNAIMEVKTTEVMTHPVGDSGKGHFGLDACEEIMAFIEGKDVVIVGPGLGQDGGTAELVRQVYSASHKPFVVDADGINAFQGHVDLIKRAGRPTVFTPHPGELARLLGVLPGDVNKDRIGVGRRFVEETGITLILKGAPTVIFTPEGKVFVNPTGNPALAKGGSGDILTGLVGGLISQGYSVTESSLLGTYLQGYAADSWVENNGIDVDLLAGDLLSAIGPALREIRDGEDRVYFSRSL